MKKLLIITRWYIPAVKSGGTVQSIKALVLGLKDKYNITILTSDRDLGSNTPYENIEFDRLIKLEDNLSIVYLSKLNRENIGYYIDIVNPNVIYLNSFFDIMTQVVMILKLQRKIVQKIILAPRGELAKGALSIKSKKKSIYLMLYKFFNLSKGIIFHATSKEDIEDIKMIFPNNIIHMIQNPKEENRKIYKLPYKEKNSLRIVFISRIAPVKNLLFALDVLNNYFYGKIIFDIYGPDEDKGYWDKCKSIISLVPNNITVNYKGFVHPNNIGYTLSKYHLFFLPTKGENFGHAIVEAMQVGLIPLISDKTPWQNLEIEKVGYSLSLNNKENFIKAIKKILEWNNEKFLNYSINSKEYITSKLNNKKTIDKYVSLF